MKKWFCCLGLISVLLWSTGCAISADKKTSLQTQVSIPPLTQTSMAITTSPTPTAKAQPTATRTALPAISPEPAIKWTDKFPMTVLNGLSGVWSPTAHAFLYDVKETGSNELYKAMGPAFQPTALTPGQLVEDYTWSPDGQKILFVGFESLVTRKFFVMSANGENLHILSPKISSSHDLWIKGWLNQTNLMYANYSGGGHQNIEIVNIKTEELASWGAFIHGAVFPPQQGYIPATTTVIPDIYQLLVISEKYPKSKLDKDNFIGGNIMELPLYQSIARKNTNSVFLDWRPNSNQMLVSWEYIDTQTWEILDQDLLLWDLEKNTLRLIATDGKSGKFSPDGKLLAYVTDGPARVDDNLTPVKKDQKVIENQATYMQILDMNTGKVQISIPILTDSEILGAQEYITLKAQFSPNGRYLIFLSPGKLQVNQDNWPVNVDPVDSTYTTINLLDLQEKKLVWSVESSKEAEFSWSPASSLLAYQDKAMNWQLLSMDDLQITAVTKTNGEYVNNPGWSYDGDYLSLVGCLPLNGKTCQSSINIFDVTLAE